MIFLCFGDHPQCLPLGVEGTLDEGGLRVDDGLLGLVNGVLDVNGRDVVDRGTAATGELSGTGDAIDSTSTASIRPTALMSCLG